MKTVTINDKKYVLEKDYKDVFNLEEVKEKCTDYFDDFDYILGDYSYGKLRMKGFYDGKNKKAKEINNINQLDDYLNNYCAYNCGYFLLKKTE